MVLNKESTLSDLISRFCWSQEDGSLKKSFKFKTYMQSIHFINALAEAAERVQHHPDLQVGYCHILVSFTTHDAGNNLTEKDIEMAQMADEIFMQHVE